MDSTGEVPEAGAVAGEMRQDEARRGGREQSAPQVLLLFAHPAYERSRANRALLEAARTLPGVLVHDLYETYPDFGIDVAAEQRLLAAAPAVVLQHPLYWYSAPALVKEWLDLVLQHGWAYGHQGHALDGKRLLSVVTAGGPRSAYGSTGANRFTLPELLRPFEQTARLCRMHWLPPFAVTGVHGMSDAELEASVALYLEALSFVSGEAPAEVDLASHELLNDLLEGDAARRRRGEPSIRREG